MPRLSFADLLDSAVPLSAADAAALALAAARALDAARESGPGPRLPSPAAILLDSAGVVTFAAAPEGNGEGDDSAALAALLRRLLRLDDAPAERRGRVPGGLLVVLARALRQIDLPPLPYPTLRAEIARFAAPDAVLASIFWRAARAPRSERQLAARPEPRALLPATAPPARDASAEERRAAALKASELRRYLREVERELYESRRRRAVEPGAPRTETAPQRTDAAADGIEPAMHGGAPVPHAPAPRHRAPAPSSRVTARVRTATAAAAIAATLVVLVLSDGGTFAPSSGRDDVTRVESPGPPGSGTRAAADRPPETARNAGTGRAQARAATGPAAHTGEAASARASSAPPSRSAGLLRSVPLVTRAQVGVDAFSPSFGPRGRTIYFHAGRTRGALMRASMNEAGHVSRVSTIVDDGAANYHATNSPDGRLIAFDSDRDGVRGVYVARADGTGIRRVSGDGYAAVPSWSPDGGRLAFVRAERGRPRVWNVWIADLASGALRRVTRHNVGQPWGASWFPGGRRLIYSRETQLVIVDLATGRRTTIASPRPGRLVRTPAVSPDGRRVVFQVRGAGVWMLDVPRAKVWRVLSDASAEEFVWSPDGKSIAFHARRAGAWGVWKVDLQPRPDAS